MDTIVLSGSGPAIRVKLAPVQATGEEKPATVALFDGQTVKTISLDKPEVTLKFVA